MAMSSRAIPIRAMCGALATLLVASCAPVDPGMGEAVKYDSLAQTVNPDPLYPAGSLQPGYDGTHGAKATERYRKDTVKAVVRETTANGGSSGSSSGSGPK